MEASEIILQPVDYIVTVMHMSGLIAIGCITVINLRELNNEGDKTARL